MYIIWFGVLYDIELLFFQNQLGTLLSAIPMVLKIVCPQCHEGPLSPPLVFNVFIELFVLKYVTLWGRLPCNYTIPRPTKTCSIWLGLQ